MGLRRVVDEHAARALMELLPGKRRRRWMLFLMNHNEVEADDWTGTLNLAVKAIGGLGTAHITQSHSWDLETGAE